MTCAQKTKTSAGFTLVELSIVLVIIGLIVGGVLVGQNLIKQAELRATVSQLEKYNTSVNTFRGKYGGLPGDLRSATRFFTAADVANGNGNGAVEDTTPADGWDRFDAEIGQFWGQLSEANMVDGNFTVLATANTAAPVLNANYPASKHGRGGVFVLNADGFNRYNLSIQANTDQDMVWSPSFLAEEAYQIDLKMDDGKSTTGSVIAVYETTGLVLDAGTGSSDCVLDLTNATKTSTDPNDYDYDFTPTTAGPVCMMQVRMN